MYFRLNVTLDMIRPWWLRVIVAIFVYAILLLFVAKDILVDLWDYLKIWFKSFILDIIGMEE